MRNQPDVTVCKSALNRTPHLHDHSPAVIWKWFVRIFPLALFLTGTMMLRGCSGEASDNEISAEEKAFLAYWLGAQNLARGLETIRIPTDYTNRPQHVPPSVYENSPAMKDVLNRMCESVTTASEVLNDVPEDVMSQLRTKHADIVRSTRLSLAISDRQQGKSHAIPNEEWTRYLAAFKHVGPPGVVK